MKPEKYLAIHGTDRCFLDVAPGNAPGIAAEKVKRFDTIFPEMDGTIVAKNGVGVSRCRSRHRFWSLRSVHCAHLFARPHHLIAALVYELDDVLPGAYYCKCVNES